MEDKKSGLQRRHFLLTLGAGGAAAAATVATLNGKPAAPAAVATAAGGTKAATGVSEHARNYYRTARI